MTESTPSLRSSWTTSGASASVVAVSAGSEAMVLTATGVTPARWRSGSR